MCVCVWGGGGGGEGIWRAAPPSYHFFRTPPPPFPHVIKPDRPPHDGAPLKNEVPPSEKQPPIKKWGLLPENDS